MANQATTTRRAAIVGALVSTAALAVPAVAAAQPKTLEELAIKFRDDARALDPTITGFFIGFDELMDGPRADRVMQLYLERKHAPIRRPRA